MGAILEELRLKNFRNHQELFLTIESQQLVLVGRNAIGKTNIIEALQLLSMLRSFRTSHWQELATIGQSAALIQARFNQNDRRLELELLVEEGRRSYTLNNKRRTREELIGLVPAVLFVPDDLDIVKGPAERRRSLIDSIGQQLSRTYEQIVGDYKRTLKQRNRLLKEQRESGVDSPILESWSESLIGIGSQLLVHRLRLFELLANKATIHYQELSGGEVLVSEYLVGGRSQEEADPFREEASDQYPQNREQAEEIYRRQLKEVQDEERAGGRSLVGPHRDEINFTIDGKDARIYASQGQQRTIALACKLAELDLIREINGNNPILLLDDVMSELDAPRRAALLVLLNEGICAVITATDTDCLDANLLERAQVVQLDG